jgi:hypothetical protein
MKEVAFKGCEEYLRWMEEGMGRALYGRDERIGGVMVKKGGEKMVGETIINRVIGKIMIVIFTTIGAAYIDTFRIGKRSLFKSIMMGEGKTDVMTAMMRDKRAI